MKISYTQIKEALKLPLPEGMSRMDTQPVIFGDDWAGMFIRGDRAAHMAFLMEGAAELMAESDPINAMVLKGYANTLSECINR